MIKRLAILSALLPLALACDKSDSNQSGGPSVVGQASAVVASDAEQKINLAVSLINIGKTADAENMLNELAARQSTLPAATQAKLADAQAQLARAKQ